MVSLESICFDQGRSSFSRTPTYLCICLHTNKKATFGKGLANRTFFILKIRGISSLEKKLDKIRKARKMPETKKTTRNIFAIVNIFVSFTADAYSYECR